MQREMKAMWRRIIGHVGHEYAQRKAVLLTIDFWLSPELKITFSQGSINTM